MFKCKPPGAKPRAGRYVRVGHNKIMEKNKKKVVPPEQILCLLTGYSVIKQWRILFAELNERVRPNMMWQKTKFYYKKKLKLKVYYTDQL